MNLYIQIKDGVPHEHPILEDNFMQAFPDVDVNNLPANFAKFVRVKCPKNAREFEVDERTYQWVDGVVTDVWSVRPMTEVEREERKSVLLNSVLSTADNTKQYAQKQANAEADVTTKNAWLEYIKVLDAWLLTATYESKIPALPRVDATGKIISLNQPGSIPNVIG